MIADLALAAFGHQSLNPIQQTICKELVRSMQNFAYSAARALGRLSISLLTIAESTTNTMIWDCE